MPTLNRTNKTITLTLDTEFDAMQVEAALLHRQWIRMVDKSVAIAQPEPEPTMSDHDLIISGRVAPCFSMPDGKTPTPVQRATVDAEQEPYSPHCIVQHIGAGLRKKSYEYAYKAMVSVGFVVLRSPRGPDNHYWEIWYLPGMWSLKGALEGVGDRRKLVEWLYANVVPGNVTFAGESWALSCE